MYVYSEVCTYDGVSYGFYKKNEYSITNSIAAAVYINFKSIYGMHLDYASIVWALKVSSDRPTCRLKYVKNNNPSARY